MENHQPKHGEMQQRHSLQIADRYRSMTVIEPPIEQPIGSTIGKRVPRKERHVSIPYSPSIMEYYNDYLQTPELVAMVGLPARGKTYISKKLCRYLNWIGFKTKVFNLGEYRRLRTQYEDHKIFKKENKEGAALRQRIAEEALRDASTWFENGGEIAIVDATNSTLERREMLEEFAKEKHYKLFYIESICTDLKIIDHNIREVKVSSPDYKQRTEESVVEDFTKRIQHYEEQYVTLNERKEPHISFIKLINAGESVEIYQHDGPIQSRIIYYLTNLHLLPRNIYFTKHGESEFNIQDRIGCDPGLTSRGKEYAQSLANFVADMNIPDLRVWTSSMKRSIETAVHFTCLQERWKILDEINTGICEGLTYEELSKKYPTVSKARSIDKFNYRYPQGENYQDVIERLEPVIMELERQSNVLVIAHEAIIRCLLGYFLDVSANEIPFIYVPLHTFFKLTPITYGCKVQHIQFPIPCVDTYKGKENKKKLSRISGPCQCIYTIE